jgi:hypothetical protein
LELVPAEMKKIKNFIQAIEDDSQLKGMVYPSVLVYGSRLKGYGEQDADIDLSLFIKPGVSHSQQARIRQLVQNALDTSEIKDPPTEFWLDEVGEQLEVHDFDDYDYLKAQSNWAHLLFGAAWVGSQETIAELQRKLLPTYFYETDKEMHGYNLRKVWLEELERDTLQYRLMHKGYQRHFPAVGGFKQPNTKPIDGNSVFWDSGYRRLASSLFIDKVFLPKLSK